MKSITFNSVHGENFKGLKEVDIPFSLSTTIKGMNGSGKTSILDLITWIIFDKDSHGNSKFEIRTLDSSGQKIHHTEIVGVLNMSVDGVEYELKKTQKEKWVKKRGQEQQEFSGNQNLFEINGFPKSDKEYKEFISSIVDESVFKLLTNPMAFSSMKWQDQRSMLMRFVEGVTLEEIATSIENFDLIAPDIAIASVDDCRKKYTKSKKELTDKQKSIPIRIDELEKSKVEVDEKALRKQEEELQAEIESSENDLAENPLPSVTDLKEKMDIVYQKMNALSEQANLERKKQLAEVQNKLIDLRSQRRQAMDELTRWKNKVSDYMEKAHSAEVEYNALGEKFAEVKRQIFDESQNTCQYCGQELPENRQEENRRRFVAEQERQKAEINAKAVGVRDVIRQAKDDAKVADVRMKECNAAVMDADKTITVIEKEESELSKEISVTGTKEYKKLTDETDAIQKQMDEYNSLVEERNVKKASVMAKKDELQNVRNQIAIALNNANINARISALQMELKDVSQKIADSDRLIFVLENYVKFLADKINDRFDGLEFKLFDVQINGGIKECCEITYNGVPYSDLNSGHRIVVGLEIIKTLQKLYSTATPVFVDNAETLNEFNMPNMDCQIVAMKVSDDPELVIK